MAIRPYQDGPPSCVDPQNIAKLLEEADKSPDGSFVEFGVYLGGTAFHLAKIARAQGRKLYLYDTFTGIPCAEPFDEHPVGCFGNTSLDAVKSLIPDAIYGVGLFPQSFRGCDPIAFAHIDCDQYQSYHDAWNIFEPRMVKGGVMIFDDYPVLEGARRAVDEFAKCRVQIELGKGIVRF